MSSSAGGVALAPVVIRLDRSRSVRSAGSAPSSGQSFSAALDRAGTDHRSADREALPGMGLLRDAARGIGRGDRLLDRSLRAARAGHVFSNQELIALQAGVYRYSQELELASKLVDKSTSALKNVLQSQR